jgi:hypothetical protein
LYGDLRATLTPIPASYFFTRFANVTKVAPFFELSNDSGRPGGTIGLVRSGAMNLASLKLSDAIVVAPPQLAGRFLVSLLTSLRTCHGLRLPV